VELFSGVARTGLSGRGCGESGEAPQTQTRMSALPKADDPTYLGIDFPWGGGDAIIAMQEVGEPRPARHIFFSN
jgi:hypothetical protein